MSNVPMSNPELMLACHEPFGFSRGGCIQLKSGRVLACAGRGFSYSDDGGMTWCQPYEGWYHNGESPALQNLVELADGSIGALDRRARPGSRMPGKNQLVFTTSKDLGRTWSQPRPMSEEPLPGHTFQNALFRTSSGRIIQPCYFAIGPAKEPNVHRPYLGGWADGEWVSCEAHHYDPAFLSCYVLFSDDEGQTWQLNSSGQIHIFLPDGSFTSTAEPSVAEVQPGKLIMMLRTRLGRAFCSRSNDNGDTWTTPQPTHLAASHSPVIVKKLPATGHLLCVWNQAGEQEVKQGYIRTRLSAAVSRNGGAIWEFFQNVESLHEDRHVEPGPIRFTAPQGRYSPTLDHPAYENDTRFTVELDPGYTRYTNHTVCALQDRVLISYGSKCKVLPLNWFYRGRDPFTKHQWE